MFKKNYQKFVVKKSPKKPKTTENFSAKICCQQNYQNNYLKVTITFFLNNQKIFSKKDSKILKKLPKYFAEKKSTKNVEMLYDRFVKTFMLQIPT